MTNQEALDILKAINEMYPRFNLTKRKATLLIPNLKKMDYKGVMKNLSAFVMDNPYPPLLNEIGAYTDEEEASVTEMDRWQEEAKKVSPAVKERFRKDMQKLLEQKRGRQRGKGRKEKQE